MAAPLIPIAALVFAITHLAFEHFNGGVKTHHFLARGDLPGFSNWLGLAILPMLGAALYVRIRRLQGTDGQPGLPISVAVPLIVSLLYGAGLATSFHFDASQVSLVLFVGLLLVAIALPVYRAEYMLGFVVGMTLVFGTAIPLLFALCFAAMSLGSREARRVVVSAFRSRRE
jgi:hypothetical protein